MCDTGLMDHTQRGIEMTHTVEAGERSLSLTCSVTDAATMLGVSTWRVYDLINRGELPVVLFSRKPGCHKRIPRSAIIKLVEGGA